MSKYLTIKETLERLRISRPTLRRLIKAGVIPTIQIGCRRRVPLDQLEVCIARGGPALKETK